MGIQERRLDKELFKEWKARNTQPPTPPKPNYIDAEAIDDDIEDAEIVTDPVERIRIAEERNRQQKTATEQITEEAIRRLNEDPDHPKEGSSTALELHEPDKWDMFREMGYNERTRVDKVQDKDPQILRIKEPHTCQPPVVAKFGIGSVWRCGCGAHWKIKRHVLCDNANHRFNKKWTRKVLFFQLFDHSFGLSWGSSRYN